MTIAEMKKAEVLTYLRTALLHLDQAQQRLAEKSELRNEIRVLVDRPLDDIIEAIEDEGYEDDFRLKS